VMYVEATKKSSAVGDIVITEQYLNKTYTVKATAIWAEKTGFRNTGNSLSADVDSKTMQDSFKNDWGSRLGLVGAETGAPMTRNAMEMEFTVSPSGMNEQPGVRFDISRSVEWKNWSTTAGTRTLQNSIPFNAFKDNPNDDDFSTDESNIPKNDHIYVIDGPGWRNNIANSARLELRFNFVEFVRVKINGSKFANTNGTDAAPNVEGSRASPLTQWYARLDLIDDGTGKWKRNNTPGENEINTGSKALGN